ncbi:MAG: RHO alpha subunit C-terminal catalytic domain-containing protein, partial [Proteobacteria bacterium]|nr:RHO alpha subunit C-terminal catalytic domain-containing protein [Pseudomonadota bacterium]
PEAEHLPPELRRNWNYYSVVPNWSIGAYPDTLEFFQVIPTGPGRSVVQGRSYGHPDTRRAMRAARYLNRRINIQVYIEDKELTQGVQAGLESESYDVGFLSEKELCVQQFHDDVRRALPVARLRKAPEPGGVAARNEKMREMDSAA